MVRNGEGKQKVKITLGSVIKHKILQIEIEQK